VTIHLSLRCAGKTDLALGNYDKAAGQLVGVTLQQSTEGLDLIAVSLVVETQTHDACMLTSLSVVPLAKVPVVRD